MEMLIVVAIIAILVAIAIPVFTTVLEKSRETADLANIRSEYAKVMMDVLDDNEAGYSESGGHIVYLKQSKDDWNRVATAQSTLESLGTIDNNGIPAKDGTCTVYYVESEQMIHFKFDGEASGGDVPGVYNFGNERKTRMSTMARALADALADADPNLVKAFIPGSKGTYNADGEVDSFNYRELWLDPNGINSLSTTRYYQDEQGKSHSYKISDLLADKGVDYSAFTDATYVGSRPVVYFDLETNKPLAVSYFKEGNTGAYRITYLDDEDKGKTYEFSDANYRQKYVYHKDIGKSRGTLVD